MSHASEQPIPPPPANAITVGNTASLFGLGLDYKEFLKGSNDLIFAADPQARMVGCNDAFVRHMQAAFGRTMSPGDSLSQGLPPEHAAMLLGWFDRALAGEVVRTTFRSVMPERTLWLDHTLSPILHEGKVVGVACVARDITELAQARDRAAVSEARFRRMAEASVESVFVHVAGRCVDINEAALRMTGYAREEIVGQDMVDMVVPPDLRAAFRAKMASGPTEPYEWEAMRKDGTRFPVEIHGHPTFGKGGSERVAVVRDISEHKRAQEALRASRQMLATVLDHFPGTVFWKDIESVYLGCNRNCALGAGLNDPTEIVGKTDYDLAWAGTEAAAYRAVDRQVIGSGRPVLNRIESQLQADGRTAWFESNKLPLRDSAGEIIGVMGTATNITLRMRAEEDLRRLNATLESRIHERTEQLDVARKEAEAANAAKSAFLANISHEVRTPMNGILGLAELLRQTPLSDEQRGWIDTLRDSGEALLRLLNDVLDISKVEAGRMVLEEAPFSLRREMAAVSNLMAACATQKNIELRVKVADGVPDTLAGDALRLRQILTNLVGNAVKFTERGWVELAVHPEEGAAPGHVRLRFSVADTGIGVPEDQLALIFDPFTQADSSVTRKYGGSGLGLSICARLAEMMGGHAFAERRADTGSVFHVVCEFNMAAAPAPAAAPRPSAPATQAVPRSRRILLVEDNLVNQKVAVSLLSRRGHAVEVAAHGEEALAASALKEFDIVLMDVQMPVMDGLEATRRIRAREKAGKLPRQRIVAMTAGAMVGDRDICLAAGMDDYITKPFQAADLYALVEQDPRR